VPAPTPEAPKPTEPAGPGLFDLLRTGYDYQKGQGIKELDRRLSAQGLLNSGAAVEGQNQFLNQLNAGFSGTLLDLTQSEADRQERRQEAESGRRERTGNEQWDRVYSILRLLNEQNPLQYAYGAAGGLADLESRLGSDAARIIASTYPTALPPPSAGGGGGGGSSLLPPLPDNSMSIGAQGLFNAQNSQSWTNLLNSVVNGFFPAQA
jgi:hypothetical protein